MALTQTRPERDSTESITPTPKPALERVLSTTDHKTIGRLWVGAGAVFGLAALLLTAVVGVELFDLGDDNIFDDSGQFVQAWSAARTLLFFGSVVPVLVGLATYLAPLQVGSSAIAFGRGAAAAFWTWLLATLVLALSYVQNGGPGGGTKDSVLLWALAFGVIVISICWALVCIATTILGARTPGMKLEQVPVSTWSFLVFALLGLVSLPILVGELGLAYADVWADYLGTKEDRLQLSAIMDGVSLAPALYWVAIPVLGMCLDILSVQSGRAIRFHKLALCLIGSLTVFAFGADLFAFAGRGRPIAFDNAVLVLATLAAVVPMILILGLGLDVVKNGTVKITAPFVGSLLSLVLLMVAAEAALLAQIDPIIGFIAQVSDQSIEVDSALLLNGTSFHEGLRGMILGAVLLGAIAAVHNWSHKIWGRKLDDRVGMLSVLLAAAGTLAWSIGFIAAGFLEQTALPDITSGPQSGVEILNLVAAIGAGLLAAALGLLTLAMLGAASGRGSAVESWTGETLEWATTSPPPVGNFAAAPVMSSSITSENDTKEA